MINADVIRDFSDTIASLEHVLTADRSTDNLYYHSSRFADTFFDDVKYTAYLAYLKEHEEELFPMLRVMNLLNPYLKEHKDAHGFFLDEEKMYVKLAKCIQQFAFTFGLKYGPDQDMLADYISKKSAAPVAPPSAMPVSTYAYTEAMDRQRMLGYEQQIGELRKQNGEQRKQISALITQNQELNGQNQELKAQLEAPQARAAQADLSQPTTQAALTQPEATEQQEDMEEEDDLLLDFPTSSKNHGKVIAELLLKLLEATGVEFLTDKEIKNSEDGSRKKKNTGAREKAAQLIELITSTPIKKQTAKNHASDRELPSKQHRHFIIQLNTLLSQMGAKIQL